LEYCNLFKDLLNIEALKLSKDERKICLSKLSDKKMEETLNLNKIKNKAKKQKKMTNEKKYQQEREM